MIKKKIEKMPEEVVKIVSGDATEEEKNLLEPDVKKIKEEKKGRFYSSIIYYLTGIEFEEKEARDYWGEILKHKYIMSSRLGRNVGIRVAALDYFTNIKRMLNTVTFVDVNLFKDIEIEAVYDKLTRLYNRRALYDIFDEEKQKATKKDLKISIVMVDIDDFKIFNDKYGHLAGDTLLYEVAKILKDTARNNDGYAIRYGGEEFLLIFAGKSKEEVFNLMEVVRKKIEERDFFKFKKLTISAGISLFPDDGKELKELIEKSDKLLYQAKNSGKNKIVL